MQPAILYYPGKASVVEAVVAQIESNTSECYYVLSQQRRSIGRLKSEPYTFSSIAPGVQVQELTTCRASFLIMLCPNSRLSG